MLKKYLLTVFFLLTSSSLIAQAKTEPFKKANTILLETSLNGKEAFTNWGKHLGQNGFSIDKSDANFLTITTGTKETKKYNVEYYLICAVSDSGIIKLKIKWRVPPSVIFNSKGTEFFDWEYSKSKATTTNAIYTDVMKMIESFGTYSVKYLRE